MHAAYFAGLAALTAAATTAAYFAGLNTITAAAAAPSSPTDSPDASTPPPARQRLTATWAKRLTALGLTPTAPPSHDNLINLTLPEAQPEQQAFRWPPHRSCRGIQLPPAPTPSPPMHAAPASH